MEEGRMLRHFTNEVQQKLKGMSDGMYRDLSYISNWFI